MDRTMADDKNTDSLTLIHLVFSWSCFIFFTLFFGTTVVLFGILLLPWDRSGRFGHFIGKIWAKAVIKSNPWWKFNIKGVENLPDSDEAVVYVSNHQSQSDIIALYVLNINFRWLAKDSLFKIPIFGWAMTFSRYVPVKRHDPHSREKCLKASARHLRNGISMLFFPEGTRSKNGVLKRFKNGAFRLAQKEKVAIVPITINGCDKLLPKGALRPNRATVDMFVHPKIYPEQLGTDELVKTVRKSIQSTLPNHLKGEIDEV